MAELPYLKRPTRTLSSMSISQRSDTGSIEMTLPRAGPPQTVSRPTSLAKMEGRGKLSPTVSSSYLSTSEYGLVGLRNAGNTCYQNAILQCLLRLDDFWKLLVIARHDVDTLGRRLLDFHSEVIRSSSSLPNLVSPVMDPRGVREVMGTKNAVWKTKEQQDALEYFLSLLDNLNDEMKARRGNPVESLFKGSLLSRTTCLSCRHVSDKKDPSFVLCLSVTEKTLQDALVAAYQQPETLKGQDQYSCDKCKKKVDAVRSLEISELPRILVVGLKRFRWTGGLAEKNSKVIKCPLAGLHLGRGLTYSLVATVQHSGLSIHTGHYTAHVTEGGKWFLMDDGSVSEISEGVVINGDTYMLFYLLNAA